MRLNLSDVLGRPAAEVFETLGISQHVRASRESDGRRYQSAPAAGVSAILNRDHEVLVIQLAGIDDPHYPPFEGELPLGLRFDMSQRQVRGLFGDPGKVFEGGPPIMGIRAVPFDRYWPTPEVNVTVAYPEDLLSIQQVQAKIEGADLWVGPV